MSDFNAEVLREFYSHRWALNHGDSAEKETPQFWDKRAEGFAAQAHSPESRRESQEFLQRFAWDLNESVLDVAAGPGTFAIPLAACVKEVVATDFSGEMLRQLQRQATAERVTNVRTITGRWLEMEKPGIFDTVLCLNSLGVIATDSQHQSQLDQALIRLRDCCSRRLIMLIPHADSPLNSTMREILGLEAVSIERRRVAILYFAMVDCGMLPDLKIIRRPFHWTFSNMAEARHTLLAKAGVIDTADISPRFDLYLQEILQKQGNGLLTLSYDVSQALFTWERT